MTVLLIIALLSLLIIAHELGHLITAKLFGVKAEEFGVGFPPRLLSRRFGETVYSLNLFPFGGFVRLLGEEDPKGPRSFAAQGRLARLVILSAGSLMNFILPLFLFGASYMVPKQVTVGEIVIEQVATDSPAQRAGLLPGDIVLRAQGRKLDNHWDLLYHTQLHLGQPLTLLVQRQETIQETTLIPRWKPPPEEGSLGVLVSTANPRQMTVSYAPWDAFARGWHSLTESLTLLRNEVLSWIVGRSTPQVGGPVAIVQIAGKAAQAGPSPLFSFAAFISINLAIINLLPLPGLDGGRLSFVVLEILRRGKRVSPKREKLVHLIGFVALLALILIVSYYDLARILSGQELLP